MKYLVGSLLIGLLLVQKIQAQEKSAIHFENSPDWATLKAKARQENKYIFLDCYATWCGPCKSMEQWVFPVDSISRLLNSRFLTARVQIDSTSKDSGMVKSWYRDARSLSQEYQVAVFPTFLFFTPEGKLIHRGIGYNSPSQFYSLILNALDSDKQYYTLKENFQNGIRDYTHMAYLANMARLFQDTTTAEAVTKTYINDYLLRLNEDQFYNRENLKILATSIRSSHDKGFRIIYDHQEKVDSILGVRKFSQHLIDVFIEIEEINPYLYKIDDNGKTILWIMDDPNWDSLHSIIQNKYDPATADRELLWAKIQWLERRKKWPEYCQNVILKVEKYGPYVKIYPTEEFRKTLALNYCAFEIFLYSDDQKKLRKALSWSEQVLNSDSVEKDNLYPSFLDTYANLLYKLGRNKEALAYEEKAVALDPKDKEIADNLKKMKDGEQTWKWPEKKKSS